MTKNSWTLLLFLLIGLLAAAIVTQLLEPIKGLSFLTRSAQITWHPQADLQVLKYNLDIQVKLNLISILGLIGSLWIYRKL